MAVFQIDPHMRFIQSVLLAQQVFLFIFFKTHLSKGDDICGQISHKCRHSPAKSCNMTENEAYGPNIRALEGLQTYSWKLQDNRFMFLKLFFMIGLKDSLLLCSTSLYA